MEDIFLHSWPAKKKLERKWKQDKHYYEAFRAVVRCLINSIFTYCVIIYVIYKLAIGYSRITFRLEVTPRKVKLYKGGISSTPCFSFIYRWITTKFRREVQKSRIYYLWMVEIGNKVTMKKWFIFNSKGLKNLDFQVSLV
jgi:hypothetical protein